ncbi:hypothetical protein HMPREF3218_0202068 [Prevotella bivia]|nr:hypothetical protein HMPREF3218_0202068 [Prevotella bivia]
MLLLGKTFGICFISLTIKLLTLLLRSIFSTFNFQFSTKLFIFAN